MKKLSWIIIFNILPIISHATFVGDSLHQVNTIQSFLREGVFHFHLRSRSLSTINKAELTDYTALGIGGGLGYYSPIYHGFHFGFSGYFTFNVFSANLDKTDSFTNSANRYEVMLFDGTDAANRSDLDRMEELYLSYSNEYFDITVGRQFIESPFANKQDNRMRPNLFGGVWTQYEVSSNLNLELGWMNRISPRGTVEWYTVGESVGLYSQGRNLNGLKGQYYGNTHSAGLGIVTAKWENHKSRNQFWHFYAQNMFNLSFLQSEIDLAPNLEFGVQALYQSASGYGGNREEGKRYIEPNHQAMAIGGKLSYEFGENLISMNYLGISKAGQFLFPREWGREQFYASLPRERFEGSGGLNAINMKWVNSQIKGLQTQLATSVVLNPSVNDFYLNKYGLPSYIHYLLGLNYAFDKHFEGLELQLLTIHKDGLSNTFDDNLFRINKVDMWHLDFMIDYKF